MNAPPARRPRWTLAVLVAVFVAPPLTAWLLYFGGWRPGDTVNYGILITPPRPVGVLALERRGGGALDAKSLSGKWTLIQVDRFPCDARCAHRLWVTRQVRITLGKDLDRVRRVLVLTGPGVDPHARAMQAAHPDLIVAGGTPAQLARLYRWLDAGEARAVEGHVFLVDPRGNLMMRYPRDLKPEGLQKDLRRLLKYSRIG